MRTILRHKVTPYILTFCMVIAVSLIIWGQDLVKEDNVIGQYIEIESYEPVEITSIKRDYNGVTILVDPRIELLASIQFISQYNGRYGLITSIESSYKQDVRQYFTPYQKHPVVREFDQLSQNGFSYDAPPHWMLYLNDNFEVSEGLKVPEHLIQRGGDKSSLMKYTKLMQDYYYQTKFDEFWRDHETLYIEMIDKVIESIGTENRIDALEAYYGKKMSSYNIILAPLFHAGGFGPSVEDENGDIAIYSIQGPHDIKEGLPTYGEEEDFAYLMWHEFGHSFVNPLTDKYEKEISKYEALYEPIKEAMQKKAYRNWKTSLNEHIVRAVVARLVALSQGEEMGEVVLEQERKEGFIYIDVLYEKLLEYESSREKYGTFETFYLELITVFQEIK